MQTFAGRSLSQIVLHASFSPVDCGIRRRTAGIDPGFEKSESAGSDGGGCGVTFRSIISLFFASSSFLAGSSASVLLPSIFDSAAASPSVVLASGSVEYHLDVASLEAGARATLDWRNCGRANDDRGTVRMLELTARVWRNSVLGIMAGNLVSCL